MGRLFSQYRARMFWLIIAGIGFVIFLAMPGMARAQGLEPYQSSARHSKARWSTHARDSQHTATSSVAAQALRRIHWQTPVDLMPNFVGNELLIHYGSPLITQSNTVILPVKTGRLEGFRVEAREGKDGELKWKMASDYLLPPHNFTPSFGLVLARPHRVYFPAAGGTVLFREHPDAPEGKTGRLAFYGMENFEADPAGYTANVMINTPLTADSAGNIYFGFQVIGPTNLKLESGIARVDADGKGSWIAARRAIHGPLGIKVNTGCAPALSHDERVLYVGVNNFDFGQGDLVALDSRTLRPLAHVRLVDPRSPGLDATISDSSTASPTVGPDGDVYFGVLEGNFPSNHDRGWLLHFKGGLTQEKIPGAFGWDQSVSIVPASVVPSYHGASTYLLMSKYNNYAGLGGDGVNKIAILDPNTAMVDPISGATVMQEVLTIVGPTPDPNFRPAFPNAVREWCINTAAVDPRTRSVIANSEDGKMYRWDLTTNTFTENITLAAGIAQAYTPTVIGPDGTAYAISNAILFAVGE